MEELTLIRKLSRSTVFGGEYACVEAQRAASLRENHQIR
jgi:hypothetical protein